ncbi:ATP-binding cassette domain-containing protein [Carboxydochorda subterranea]|uniref:ATP-binding cassette domain-containing protein n=2 Tax=Carboxydichorda subterranea TaxID=3109565 RepID=A0ABZ1BVU9_9FIRM|nr:ATP-binding cassette domain-containing protein [Limnochorda sp. L945t]WRP16666.1 ATP-binding cassette domain-containing protein [Limnochorda sp. L945t]
MQALTVQREPGRTGLGEHPAPGRPMVLIEGLTKVFRQGGREVVALDDVHLSVRAGEIFGIIGLSGAGKSTLVRCINLLERPDRGRIEVDGLEMTSLDARALRAARRRIGMVFQHFHLLRSRSVMGNVAFPLEIAGVPRAQIRRRVMELLELVGLADRADAYPSELSGGQRQRVGIARALAPEPKVLLCDEPTSALDAETTTSILELLRDINRTLGITVLLITHELPVVQAICHRVAVMADARVQEVGDTASIITRPRSQAGRRLVGAAAERALAALRSRLDGAAPGAPDTPAGKLFRLAFLGPAAEQPVISRVVREFDVMVNIIHGSIDRIGAVPFGVLVVAMDGRPEAVDAAAQWLREQGVEVVEWSA